MPDSVIGSCQVDKDGTGLLFRFECILNALREQSDLTSASKTRLLPWEQRVNKRFDADVDKLLENLVGNTEQGDRTIAPWQMESGPGALPDFKNIGEQQRTPDERNSRRHSQDVIDQPSKGQTLPVKRAEMSADSHLRISRF